MLYEAIIEKVKIPTKHFLLFHTSVLQMGGASLTKAILKKSEKLRQKYKGIQKASTRKKANFIYAEIS